MWARKTGGNITRPFSLSPSFSDVFYDFSIFHSMSFGPDIIIEFNSGGGGG